MSSVSEVIVREYFEGMGYLLQQPRKYIVMARSKRPEEEVDFIAVQPAAQGEPEPVPADRMVVGGDELRRHGALIVSVRGWHTDRFSASTVQSAPEVVRFADPSAVKGATHLLGGREGRKVLCVPGLPASPALRKRVLEVLREKGVDLVVLFPTMLRELIAAVETTKNYDKSDLLQTLRILKNYDLLKDGQLELFRGRTRRRKAGGAPSA